MAVLLLMYLKAHEVSEMSTLDFLHDLDFYFRFSSFSDFFKCACTHKYVLLQQPFNLSPFYVYFVNSCMW